VATSPAGVNGLTVSGMWTGDGGQEGTHIDFSRGPVRGGRISGSVFSGGALGIDLGLSDGVQVVGNRFERVPRAWTGLAPTRSNVGPNNFGSGVLHRGGVWVEPSTWMTPGRLNVYWSQDRRQYELQNLRGKPRSFRTWTRMD
jgi:hypothetical protein